MKKSLALAFFACLLAFFVQKAQAQQPVIEPAEEVELSDEEVEEMIENGGVPFSATSEKEVVRPALPEPQDGPPRRNFDQSSYEKAVAGIDYSRDFEKPKQAEKPSSGPNWGLPDWDFGGIGQFFQWLFIALGVGLIAWMIYQSAGGPVSRSLGQPLDASAIDGLEDRLHETDFEYLVAAAAEKGEFALALRLYFLAVLKALSQKGAIKFQKEKTNRDYLRELSGSEFRGDFQRAALLFDRVWYGEEAFGREAFDDLAMPAFSAFLRKIG